MTIALKEGTLEGEEVVVMGDRLRGQDIQEIQ
jgi:hypothetical protein